MRKLEKEGNREYILKEKWESLKTEAKEYISCKKSKFEHGGLLNVYLKRKESLEKAVLERKVSLKRETIGCVP